MNTRRPILIGVSLVALVAVVLLAASLFFSQPRVTTGNTGTVATAAATVAAPTNAPTAAAATTYQNPVFQPDLADPSVIKGEDGYFYAYGTENDWLDGKGPRLVPILRSRNLTQWEYVGNAFATKPTWKPEGGGLWAPDISFHDGTYFLYYSFSIWGDANPGIGVATAKTPAGPFTDHGALFRSVDIGVRNSIDPQVFQDDDGKRYMIWGSFNGIYGIELAADGFSTAGEKFQMAGTAYEAPYVIKRDGAYYLFLSSGSCCEGANSTYFVSVGRAETLKGPYENPIGGDLLRGPGAPVVWTQPSADGGKHFVGPGHIAIVQDDDGVDWLLYHAIDPENPNLGEATRRPLMLDPLVWKDGWPTVAGLVASTSPQPAPTIR